MAYTVNKTNSLASPNSYTVQDSVINQETDLSLIGKGYSGYGETIAENFLHILENFSDTTAPTKPIKGQLWFDSGETRLKVYSGTTWGPLGGATYASTAPAGQVTGDIWIDSDTGQLYFYNGATNILVGPPGSTGTTNGFVYATIADNTDTNQNITKWYNDGNLIAIISEDTFIPKSSISGFATITKGITLSTAITGLRFAGTAEDSDALGSINFANFLTSNANDTSTGTLGIVNDDGITVGAGSDLTLAITGGTTAVIKNITSDGDLQIGINDGGVATTLIHLDGADARVGINTTTPTATLDVNGVINATSFSGALTGNVTGTLTGTSTLDLQKAGGTLTGTLISRAITPSADATYDIGTSLLGYNTVYAKATSAQYADLAEKYTSDSNYDIGTVVIFGGDKEITQSTIAEDTRVAGVISENPAYLMNDESEGQAVALVGKVKCKVHGNINKGDLLTTCGQHPGCAKKAFSPKVGSIVGKAMEDYVGAEESVILISVGRQ